MNQKNYLINIEAIFGSVSKLKLLKTLFKYQNIEYSISFLAKDAKISINQAKLIIDEYKSFGILNYRSAGKSALVNLKKNTYYFTVISQLITAYENSKDKLIEMVTLSLKKEKISEEAWIYGSFARDELKTDSDIDILLLFESKDNMESKKEKIYKLQSSLSYFFQKRFSFLSLSKKEFDKEYKSLKDNILSEGVKIHGQS